MDEEWDQLESEQEEERGDEDEEMMEVDWEQEREVSVFRHKAFSSMSNVQN